MIRGIPKEGWKLENAVQGMPQFWVMIRGIPKEGWKLSLLKGRCFPRGTCVMIRGIPKEGWKLVW